MTEYLTEQEQIQQLKSWIKQYGLTVLAGIVIAVVITSGFRYWQNYRNKILFHASAIYDEMLTARAQNNTQGAITHAKKLLNHYSSTPYSKMAALMIAEDATLNKNYSDALTQLDWTIDHSKDNALREIARTRKARIFIAENKPDDALTTLEKLDDTHFIGLVDEIRGDAYLAKNDNTSARQSYQLALEELPDADVARPILQMKYDNLAINN